MITRKPNERRRLGLAVVSTGLAGTLLGAALGGMVEASFGIGVSALFPGLDKTEVYLRRADEIVRAMATDRKELLDYIRILSARAGTSPETVALTQAVNMRVENLFLNGTSLRTIAEAAVADTKSELPGPLPPVRTNTSPGNLDERTSTDGASSTLTEPVVAEPELWIGTGETRLIGVAGNAFGVGGVSHIKETTGNRPVKLNNKSVVMTPGSRLQYPDPERDCFITYLRTEDPDTTRDFDERHGFVLRCYMKSAEPLTPK